ncbi:hypothetical protein SLS62_010739 [Diatrype stigma]|uniref:Uncharacterized protein n=1 Tax=Diatrype stigma TaxID=117547 RepID=A0AAN9YHH6_9PEZI
MLREPSELTVVKTSPASSSDLQGSGYQPADLRMEAPRGPCFRCGINTSRLCNTCGDEFICSDLCNEFSTAEYTKTCGTHEKTTTDCLLGGITRGEIPVEYDTCRDFGFETCSAFTDRSSLFGVYKTLIVNCSIAPPNLNKWREQRRMLKMISETFKGHKKVVPEYCHDFSLENPELFE